MPFFGRKKKKKKDKPEPPPRSDATRLSAGENIYMTAPGVNQRLPAADSGGSNVDQAGYVNSVPVAPARQGSNRRTAPLPPPRAGSARSSVSDPAAGVEPNVPSTVVFNEHYDGSVASGGVMNTDDDADIGMDFEDHGVAPWQTTPVEKWNEQDVIDWLLAVKLDYFVDMFEGCGIDGDYLSQVTERDLLDLDIEEEDIRASFLLEVEKLKKRPKSAPVVSVQPSNKKEISTPDNSTLVEASGELETLLKLQEDQESRIDADIAKLKEEQKLADQLISSHQTSMQSEPQNVESSKVHANSHGGGGIISPPTTFTADGTHTVPVEEWTDGDVITWLEVVGLIKHVPAFKAKDITGKDLAEIDLPLLEDMNIKSANEREEVLSKIYELFNPTAAANADQLLNEAQKSTGYERQKYMAAVSALNSQENVQLPPPGQSNGSTTDIIKSVEQSNGGKHKESKRKSHSGFSKFKEAISPKSLKKKDFKDSKTVQIWSNTNQAGKFRCDSFHATDSTTTDEMIRQCLEQHGLVEDARLYSIVEVPLVNDDVHDPVPERQLRANEFPLKIQKNWLNTSSYRFELRHKQGTVIKVMDRISGHKARGKMLAVSASTPSYEVLQLALRKFDMTDVDISVFCLLELDNNGDIRVVQDMEIPSQLTSNQFILCDKANVENQIAGTEEVDELDNTVVSRNTSSISQTSKVSSTSSKNSSKMASIELELSQNSEKDGAVADKYDGLKRDELHVKVMELEMKVRELQDELQMNRDHVNTVMEQNKVLQERDKKLILLQKTITQLQDNYTRQQSRMKKKQQQRQEVKDREVLPLAVADLKGQLEHTTQEVQTKEKQVQKLCQELQMSSEQSQRNSSGVAEMAELEYRIASEESNLLTLQQKQMSQFTELELATYEHQLQQEKKKEEERSKAKQQSLTLHSILPLKEAHTVIAMEIVPGHYGYDFIVSSGEFEEDGVFVTSCDSNGVLKEGDRLIEVNGVNVFQSSDAEVNTMLNSKMSAKIVVLREQPRQQQQPIADPKTTQKMNRMEEELSLAAANLQSEKRVTAELREEVARLKILETKAKKADDAEIKVKQLQKQLSDSESQRQDLENTVDDLRRSQQRYSETQESVDQLEQQTKTLELEIKKKTAALAESAKRINNLQKTCQQQEAALAAVTEERDDFISQLENADRKKQNSVVYLNDDDVPVWEVLKTAQKSEILNVLQENIEESTRQKQYLDRLYAVMLDQAPSLLEQLDEDFDEEDMSGDEEFC